MELEQFSCAESMKVADESVTIYLMDILIYLMDILGFILALIIPFLDEA